MLIFIFLLVLVSDQGTLLSKRTFQTEVYMFEGGPNHVYQPSIYASSFNLSFPSAVIVTPTALVGSHTILFTTSGTVSNGTLNMVCVGGVYAVNAENGKVVWNESFPNMVMTQPLVVNGIIVVGVGNNMFVNQSFRGTGVNEIVALNEQGHVIWVHKTRGESMPTPVFFEGDIVEATGGGYVCSLDLSTGHLVWASKIPSYVSMSSPLLVGEQLLFGGANPYVFYDINVTNGKVIWETQINATGGLDDSSPSFCNGIVITGFTDLVSNNTLDYKEVGINITNGQLVWCLNEGEGPTPSDLESPPATLYDGYAFVTSPGVPYLYAVNYSNGNVIWKVKTGEDIDNPAVSGNLLFVLNHTGFLYVINLQGKVINVVKTGVVPGPGEPLLTENTIVIFGVNGVVKSIPLSKVI